MGRVICRWIERNLVHGEGDFYSQPIKLRPFQRAIIYQAYELLPDGQRVYKRVLLGLPKGQGKTELAAMLCCVEFGGPCVFDGWNPDGSPRGKARVSPEIPVAAASFEQADLVFGAVRVMLREGTLVDAVEVYDTEVLFKNRPGRLFRVAAVAGTNDGGKPTFIVGDELHEWLGNKARVWIVLSNGRAKRRDAWELVITTAGWDMESLLGKMYRHGKRVVAGEAADPSLLFLWWEAEKYVRDAAGNQVLGADQKPVEVDLKDPVQLERAIRQSNPAIGDFLSLENVVARYTQIPEYEFRRYHLNQWSSAPDRWLPQGAFEARALNRPPPPNGARVALSFDGSWSGDSTCVVGTTLDDDIPHQFVVEAWEKPEGKEDWHVDVEDVEQCLRNACTRWDVVAVACDPHRWQRSLSLLESEGLPMVQWPSHSTALMVPACTQYYEAIQNSLLTHDGDPRMAAHFQNAVVRTDARGSRITKESKDSPRKIDLAVAAVIGYDMYIRHREVAGELGVDFVGTTGEPEREATDSGSDF